MCSLFYEIVHAHPAPLVSVDDAFGSSFEPGPAQGELRVKLHIVIFTG